MDVIKIAVAIVVAFVAGLVAIGEISSRYKPAELGVRAWTWAEDYCRDYGGLADFRVVQRREAKAVCEQGDEQAIRTLR